jgi:hypothetical protein
MSQPEPGRVRGLLRDVLVFQLKLMVDALRDLVMSPIALAAAFLDLLLSRQQPPRFFLAMLRLGRRTEIWIDLWSSRFEGSGPQAQRIDDLLLRIEKTVRDPHSGARRARVLKRWAEMTLARQRRRNEGATKPAVQDEAPPQTDEHVGPSARP